jgi:hypothetical protein
MQGFFDDERTVAPLFAADRVLLFCNGSYTVWPFLIVNLNLWPEKRYCL